MKPGKWYPLERLEDDVEDKVSYRWPHKTERMWELRLEGRVGTGIRAFFERTHRGLAALYPAPAIHVFFPQDLAVTGHLLRARKVWDNLPICSYAHWREKLAPQPDAGYCGTGIAVVPSKHVLRRLAEESPLFAPIWEELKGMAPDDCGIYLAGAPDAAWLESIQRDEARLHAAFHDTRHLDKIGVKLHPPNEAAKLAFRKAMDLTFDNDDENAEKILRDLHVRYPGYWRVWGALVKCLIRQGRAASGYAILQQLQRRYPDCLLVDRIAVNCCMELREWRQAERHIKRVWGLNPWDPYLPGQYAVVACGLQDYGLALRLFEICAEHGAAHEGDRRSHALALSKMRREAEALEILKKLEDDEQPDPVLLNQIGALLTRMGRPQEGLAYCRRALELTEEWSPGWDSLGLAHLRLGNVGEATAAFLKAIHLNQNSPDAWRHLLHAYHRGGQAEKLESAKAFARQVLPGELARFEKEKGTELAE